MADIGNWVRRKGKWHLVESVVSGDAVTRCGKRMDQWTASGGGLMVSKVMPLTRMIGQPQLCKAGCEAPLSVPSDVVDFIDVPVIDGVATLPNGRTIQSTSQIVRVPVLVGAGPEDDGSTQPELVP